MSSNANGNERRGVNHVLRSLRHRNYRLFFTGQGISLIGTWMQSIALSWLIYRITSSALMLGVVGFSSQIPSFLIAPFGGLIADRFNRRSIILVTQTCAMIQALILAFLVLTGRIQVWQIITLSIFIGFVNAFDMPTRQAFVVDMTQDKEDLSNAIALNSTMFNSARLVGPSVAGIVIAAFGEGICFLLNGLSYIAVIISLLSMRITPGDKPDAARRKALHELKEGFKYAFGFPPIRSILMMLGLVSLVGMPYSVLMPVFAKSVLHGTAGTLGLLTGVSGIGALIGAIYLAGRRSVLGLGRWIPTACVIFGVGLIAFAQSRTLWLSLILVVFIGFGMIVQMASSNTVLQTIADERMRGRVMSFYTVAFMGTAPFGSLLAGWSASRIGPQATVSIGGIFCIIGAAIFASRLPKLRELVRPIYVRLGILPEVAAGLQTASIYTTPPEERG